jgi:uncharacterized protein YcbX
MSATVGRVASLHSYPLKSGHGHDHEAAEVGAMGFRGDRRFMVVDAAGHFVTQRGYPRLALVDLAMTPDGTAATLRIPECDAIDLPLGGGAPAKAAQRLPAHAARRDVMIWGQWVPAEATDPRADQALSAYLGAPVKLVHFPADGERLPDLPYADLTDRVAYADGFPFLVIGTASLAALNERLTAGGAAAVPMRRFRPNIVVATDVPFVEDRWRAIRIAGIAFALVKRCGRCVIVNVDPATGRTAPGVLEALAAFRKEGTKVLFGQNAIHRGEGWVRVGDPVEVLDEGPPC